jgi:hypothetical protein
LSKGSFHPVIASSELEFLNNVKSRFFGNLGICAEVEFTHDFIDVQTVFFKTVFVQQLIQLCWLAGRLYSKRSKLA